MISFEVIVHFSVPVLFIITIHRHNQNLVGTLHKGVPTVVYRHENCCINVNWLGSKSLKPKKVTPVKLLHLSLSNQLNMKLMGVNESNVVYSGVQLV